MKTFDYDLVTIGAGSGGVRATRLCAAAGARTAIIEHHRIGGTCVIRGCVPKKYMVYAAEYAHSIAEARHFGFDLPRRINFDWRYFVKARNAEVQRLSSLYEENLNRHGVELFLDSAQLVDQNTLLLPELGKKITAKRILIATGAVPFVDSTIPGHEIGLTSDDIFELDDRPRKIIINGGGYVALEFACLLAGLGSEVSLVFRRRHILRGFDRETAGHLTQILLEMGISLYPESVIKKVVKNFGVRATLSTGAELAADCLLWATGRQPATQNLGLKTAGVKTDSRGAILTDGDYRSSVDSIFAIGDVRGDVQLTPVAIREGEYFAAKHQSKAPSRLNYDLIPKAIFTTPGLSSIGLSEEQIKEKGLAAEVYSTVFHAMKNKLSGNPHRYFFKILCEPGGGKLLGAHLLAPESAEMIQMLAIAFELGATKKDLDRTVAVHPSMAEEIVTLRQLTRHIDSSDKQA